MLAMRLCAHSKARVWWEHGGPSSLTAEVEVSLEGKGLQEAPSPAGSVWDSLTGGALLTWVPEDE